jgi:hypothetical protein
MLKAPCDASMSPSNNPQTMNYSSVSVIYADRFVGSENIGNIPMNTMA